VARTYQNIRLFAGLSAADTWWSASTCAGMRRSGAAAALALAHREERAAREAAEALLSRVGLRERAGTPAFSLSYGEQRRVEIARALRRSRRWCC